jgi:DNA-binding MarR family transcriptional regulator
LPQPASGYSCAHAAKRQEHTSHLGSPAIEDYLEQIHNLIAGKGYARVVDIAQNLGISQASVTNMIQKLDAEGLSFTSAIAASF